jgi:NADH-ubiquinone oxidoreductase chain 5
MTFLGNPNGPKKSYNNVHEADIFIIIALVFLSLFSIFFGYFANDAYIGLGSDFMGISLFQHPNNMAMVEAEFSLPIIIKLLPAIVTIIGALSAVILYLKCPNLLFNLTDNKIGKTLYTFFNGKYLLDIIYNSYIIRGGLSLGHTLSKYLDRGAFEYLGPNGLSLLFSKLSAKLNRLDDGIVTNYATYMVISALLINIAVFNIIINPKFLLNISSFTKQDSLINFNLFLLDTHLLIFFISVLFLLLFTVKNKNKINY